MNLFTISYIYIYINLMIDSLSPLYRLEAGSLPNAGGLKSFELKKNAELKCSLIYTVHTIKCLSSTLIKGWYL